MFAFSTLEVSVESSDGHDTLTVAAESSDGLDTLDDTLKGLGEAGEPCHGLCSHSGVFCV